MKHNLQISFLPVKVILILRDGCSPGPISFGLKRGLSSIKLKSSENEPEISLSSPQSSIIFLTHYI